MIRLPLRLATQGVTGNCWLMLVDADEQELCRVEWIAESVAQHLVDRINDTLMKRDLQ